LTLFIGKWWILGWIAIIAACGYTMHPIIGISIEEKGDGIPWWVVTPISVVVVVVVVGEMFDTDECIIGPLA